MKARKAFAKESTHWYASPETVEAIGHLFESLAAGDAIDQAPSADGKKLVRANVSHARKYEMVPGVTGPLNFYAKDALMDWKGKECAKTGLRDVWENGVPIQHSDFDINEWSETILQKQKKYVRDTADNGTLIHAACEEALLGRPHDHQWNNWVSVMQTELDRYFDAMTVWRAEESFFHKLRFGGRTDLFATNLPVKVCGDIKTRERLGGSAGRAKAEKSRAAGKPLTYHNYGRLLPRETEPMQIAANMKGWGMDLTKDIGFNMYLDRDDPEGYWTIIYTPQELLAAWEVFKCLHRIFMIQRGLVEITGE